MSQTLALAMIGIALLAVCAIAMQTTRAVARARIRRQERMLRLCSVVTGSPDDQASSSPQDGQAHAGRRISEVLP